MSVEQTDDERTEQRISGVVTATVVANEDPDGMGRVKVRFPTVDAGEAWAPMATLMAGDGYGTYFLPEVEEEVLVAFEEGDPHRPYVVGSLWTETARPPVTDVGDNDVRQITSRSGHEVVFDDDQRDGRVRIETDSGHRIVLEDTSDEERILIEDKIGENRMELDSKSGEVSIDAAQRLSLSAPEVEIAGDSSVDVSSKRETSVSGASSLDLSSKGQAELRSSGVMNIDAAGPLSVTGAIIQLN